MKILVDTSVWSLLLHRKKQTDHPAALFLREKILSGSPLFVSGIIFQEVLQGVRSDSQFHTLKNYLADFELLEATQEIHEKAAQLFNQCRKKGISAHTIDCLIAAMAIEEDCHLLTTDADFQAIARLSSPPLKIVSYTSLPTA